MEIYTLRDQLNSLSCKVQDRLFVLGLACKADVPRETKHVLHRLVDSQSAGVVERGAAVVVLTAQQVFDTVILE